MQRDGRLRERRQFRAAARDRDRVGRARDPARASRDSSDRRVVGHRSERGDHPADGARRKSREWASDGRARPVSARGGERRALRLVRHPRVPRASRAVRREPRGESDRQCPAASMSLNVGGIHVLAKKGIDRARVVSAIKTHWKKLGAKPLKGDPLSLSPLSVQKTAKLGFIVANPGADATKKKRSWIAIYDSERYHADAELARVLAKELGTLV